MDELDILTIKQRAVKGVAALASGALLLQIITIASQFVITLLVTAETFGVYTILSAAVSILVYFSDIGLAAALIQKKEKLTQEDLSTTFTIQQILVLILVIAGLLSSGLIANFYRLNVHGLWLFRALVISFLLASLKTIPTILLERSIQFTKLTIVSIIEAIVFYGIIIVFAMTKHGIESFTYAVLFRGIVGLVVIYILSPWKPSLSVASSVAKRLLTFGIPIQANSLIALAKDDVFLLYLGKALTHSQVGYYGWAKSWSEAPLRLIMDAVSKVMFPVYSRLQHDKEALSKMIEKSLFFQSALIFPAGVGLAFIINPLVQNIPNYYSRWHLAIPLFYFFIATSIFASIAAPLTQLLNATGKVKKTLSLMIFWTVLTWTITPIFISFFGYLGAAIAASIVGASTLITLYVVKRVIPFSIMKSFASPVIGSSILGVVMYIFSSLVMKGWIGIGEQIIIGTLVYGAIIFLLEQKNLKSDILFIKQILGNK